MIAQAGKVLGQDVHIGQVTIRCTDAQVGPGFLSNLLFYTKLLYL